MSRKKRQIKTSSSDSKLNKDKVRHSVKSVHVYANNGKWSIKKSGASRNSKNFDTKRDAIEYGRSLARKSKDALVIHNRDGKIQYQNSYGEDVFPSKN